MYTLVPWRAISVRSAKLLNFYNSHQKIKELNEFYDKLLLNAIESYSSEE